MYMYTHSHVHTFSQVRESVVKGPAFAGRMTMASFTVTLTLLTPKRWTVPVLRRKWSVEKCQTLVSNS